MKAGGALRSRRAARRPRRRGSRRGCAGWRGPADCRSCRDARRARCRPRPDRGRMSSRQDPNVILVGEIRDQETADIALGAAQTGHLLLSTLHTNDATATVTRLFDLGIQPFLIASSLIGIVAQRLVRRNCPACQVPRPPGAEAIEKAGGMARLPAGAKWTAGAGCDQCEKSGMKGRIAIHEVLASSDEVRGLISARATEQLMKKAAVRAGMRTLLDDGIDKAARGLTTLEEVLRVVSPATRPARWSAHQRSVVPVVAPLPAPIAPPRPTGPGPARAGGRVLVVEDSPTIDGRGEVLPRARRVRGVRRRKRSHWPGRWPFANGPTSSSATSTCRAWAAWRW